ncbi:hypothetical protein KIPB_008955 [Kipferlia bialata]|uniref:Uncharacterized protein n=1 Tax=Kipferlia bialata TaxID=797122 RepID=A0A9K3D1J0_9EUKA|nr:hypothetical protein KIPB_008955 [Kipferlia bialata]|eukprot:g8955.t1
MMDLQAKYREVSHQNSVLKADLTKTNSDMADVTRRGTHLEHKLRREEHERERLQNQYRELIRQKGAMSDRRNIQMMSKLTVGGVSHGEGEADEGDYPSVVGHLRAQCASLKEQLEATRAECDRLRRAKAAAPSSAMVRQKVKEATQESTEDKEGLLETIQFLSKVVADQESTIADCLNFTPAPDPAVESERLQLREERRKLDDDNAVYEAQIVDMESKRVNVQNEERRVRQMFEAAKQMGLIGADEEICL